VLRPVDLAREHGLSTQAVRNYDEAGALPPAERSATGYRRYTAAHARALRAFLALRGGHGHGAALEIMRAVHRGDREAAYRLIDTAHLELAAERATRAEVAEALAGTALKTVTALGTDTALGSGSGRAVLSVGELARRLGVHPATLRTWEDAGILRPVRARTGYREYGPECVRDAEIARQLRRGGYPLRRIARFVDEVRAAGGAVRLAEFLDAWQDRITARGRRLLRGAAQLDAYLNDGLNDGPDD
jgi:DNA-binding transcriptional MerR regulator